MSRCFVRLTARPRAARLLAPWLAASLAAAAIATPGAHAQVVTPKTLPVHQNEQFSIFPAARAGMAGVGIALDDSLADPFANPARAVRLGGSLLFGMPFLHGITEDRGGGITFPVGTIWSRGQWAGTGVFALQSIDRAGPARWGALSERTATNQYATASLARRIGEGSAVGVSAYWAGLGAIDGVDLLYAGSDTIRQHGGLVDLRAGYTKRWTDGRSLDFVATHGRTDMTHDVHFTTWRWDSTRRAPMVTRRSEHNVDRTHLWSAHARADRPMGTAGWRVGALGTATRLSHPKIPNYEIMNVPRDPGTTYAFNAGVGVSHAGGPATFGMDVVLEPITSETWADAERDTARTGGGVIPKGARTIENAFRFNNAILRFGFGHQPAATDSGGRLGYQLGVAVKKIDYRLEQVNHVQGGARRTQREHWVEWSPTFAVRYAARAYDFEYAFRATCGPSPCGSGDRGIVVSPVDAASPGTGGIIVAPSRPIDLDLGSSYSHRLAVIIPIR